MRFGCTSGLITFCLGCASGASEHAVVAVTSNGRFFCSGTVIAPETVLSAAHCLTHGGGGAYEVSTSESGGAVRVVRKYRHPEYEAGTFAHDVAIFRLASPIPGVTPLSIFGDSFESSDVGRAVRHVGFVRAGDSWRRSSVRSRIRSIGEFHVESGERGAQTCAGFSGGPLLVDQRVAGVVSHGDEACVEHGFDTRIDVELPWIQRTVTWEERISIEFSER